MLGKNKITLALSAVEDLDAIRTWYADHQIPKVGERLVREVLTALERLMDFPESGRIVLEFGFSHLREIIHSPFRIVYRVDKHVVRVVRVWRSERQLKVP